MFFRRIAAASVLALSLALPLSIVPAQSANLTRVEIGRPNTTAFLLSGGLVGGELLKLQAEVAKLPPDHRVAIILDSPGGLMLEGLKLGRFFHEAKIATYVFAGSGEVGA